MVFGSSVLAPLGIGEPRIEQAPAVFLVLSLFGSVFVAIAVGTVLGRRETTGRMHGRGSQHEDREGATEP